MANLRDIVVIGASVGGFDAVGRLVAGLPSSLAASLFVVIHSSPTGPRLTAELLGRRTKLIVDYATHGLGVERGHVYIAPPDHHMTLIDPGFLQLDQGPKDMFHRPAANTLFKSAAHVYGRRVIGIVLTGGDGDGTKGLIAIKAVGGIGVVQEPYEAKDPSMPRTALQEADPAYRVPIADMPGLLMRLVAGDAYLPV